VHTPSVEQRQGVCGARTDRLKSGCSVYFADPYAFLPAQAPIENTNGLIAQYFPKGADFSTMTVKSVS